MNLNLVFFPKSPSIDEQLSQQGYKFDKTVVDKFQNRLDFLNKAITCADVTHTEAYETAKSLAEEIKQHVFTYVEPIVVAEEPDVFEDEPIKEKAKKKPTKKTDSRKTTKKTKKK